MNDIQSLDEILLLTLRHLMSVWHDKDTGIVACTIKDSYKITTATSIKKGSHWLHAERNAYNKFIKEFNAEPSSEAAFIITLSPCIKSLKYRSESSCIELIKRLKINRIHFGVLDTMHSPTIALYESLGLVATESQAPSLSKMCNKLMSLFARYDSRINHELPVIKKQLGNEFFLPINNKV